MDRTIVCTEPIRSASDERMTCIEEARARQARCRESYRKVIGTSAEYAAYQNLLEATRAVLACQLMPASGDRLAA